MKSERTDLLEITWQTGPGARASARLGGRRLCKRGDSSTENEQKSRRPAGPTKGDQRHRSQSE